MRFSFPSVDVSDASRRVALCHRSSIYLRPSLYVAGGFFCRVSCHLRSHLRAWLHCRRAVLQEVYPPSVMKRSYSITPVSDIHTLHIVWPLRSIRRRYREANADFIAGGVHHHTLTHLTHDITHHPPPMQPQATRACAVALL
jgi:hypothetical protein